MIRLLSLVPIWLMATAALAQQPLLEADAVAQVLAASPAIRASVLSVQQSQQLLKGVYTIPNLEVFTDSPTGSFYTVGINQSFQLPTVYRRQYGLQRQQVGLAQAEQRLTENEVRYRVRGLYLTLQYADAVRRQYQLQDSVYAQLRTIAARQFVAGQIDFLSKTFTETQAGEVHNQRLQAEADVQTLTRQLQQLTSRREPWQVTPLIRAGAGGTLVTTDSVSLGQNPAVALFRQTEVISEQQIGLERARLLPSLLVGYYNQGSKETTAQLRFRFGISLPVWLGQYRSRTLAAQTGLQLARQRTDAQIQTISTDLQQAQGDFAKFRQSLDYYETTGLRQADDLVNTARRLVDSGQTDFVSFLRTTNDAYAIRQRYLDTLRSYNLSLLTINFLTGNL